MATCNLFLITDINQSPPCKNVIFGKVNVEDHQFFVLQECAARTLTGVFCKFAVAVCFKVIPLTKKS